MRILEPLPSYSRLRGEASGYGDKTYTFNLNDGAEHQFSFYSLNNIGDVSVKLKDLSGNVLDDRVIAQAAFNNGVYVTYKVKGGFQLFITTGGAKWGPSGFFFDDLLSDKPSGLSASTVGREITLSWTITGSFDQVIVERSANDTVYEIVDRISGSAVSYVDEDLLSSSTYYCRLRYKEGTVYGESTTAISAATANYADTSLTFLDDDVQMTVGDTEPLEVLFESVVGGERTPLAGKEVSFRLAGA